MKIESMNTLGHDGSYVVLEDGALICSIEGEKDSRDRYSLLTEEEISRLKKIYAPNPDVSIAGFWPYFGITGDVASKEFKSPHERAHIMCAYGMSPYPQGQSCYVLCWEGYIGKFYYVDEYIDITEFPTILEQPGLRYELVFELAKGSMGSPGSGPGKLMALTGFASKQENKWKDFITKLLEIPPFPSLEKLWDEYTNTKDIEVFFKKNPEYVELCEPLKDLDVESQGFKDFSYYFSQAIFDKFYDAVKKHVTKKAPLLITGGCGLNCDWNTQWKESGLFSDVFIPPVCNDSGIAIGLAIDAQWSYSRKAKINWSPYAGEEFIDDVSNQ